MADSGLEKTVSFLEDLAKGARGHEMDAMSLEGLQIVDAQPGLMRCRFVVPISVSDKDGNWHVGAMTTAMEVVASAAVLSLGGQFCKTNDLNISCFAAAKFQEKVDIEAKIVGTNGKLRSVVVETRRYETGELIALGRMWSSPTSFTLPPPKKVSQPSRL